MPPKDKKNNKQQSKHDVSQSEKTGTENTRTESGLSFEAENQFEVELCWCVQQLQLTLDNGKIVGKQAMDLKKNLNALRSNNTSLIRKRQIMRNTLGDYRSKMAEDERKFGKTVHNVKFTSLSSLKSTKSVFLKKAQTCPLSNTKIHKANDDLEQIVGDKDTNIVACEKDASFKFNFIKSD